MSVASPAQETDSRDRDAHLGLRRTGRYSRVVITAVVLALSSVSIGGCQSQGSVPKTDGALSATLAESGGAMGLTNPDGSGAWSGTFGSNKLCTTGGPVTLKSVSYDIPVSAATPPATRVRTVEPDDTRDTNPVAMRLGVFGAFTTTPHRVAGRLHDVEGFVVDEPCDANGSAGDGPPFAEVITTLSSGSGGTAITSATLIYQNEDGSEHQVQTRWTFALCGALTKEFCGG